MASRYAGRAEAVRRLQKPGTPRSPKKSLEYGELLVYLEINLEFTAIIHDLGAFTREIPPRVASYRLFASGGPDAR
jgi:hypothetical protein